MRGYMLLAGLAILGVSYVNASIESTFRKAGESIFDTGRKNALDFQEVAGLPTKPEEVTFALYTSDFRDMYTNVTHDNYKRLTNKEGRIYFLVHGWLEDRHATWYNDLKEGLLNKEPNAFVVEVDWHEPARQAYSFSSYNTEDVGNLIGTLIHNVHSKYDVPLKNFVVIGHSLGGQVAGWVGKKVQSLTQGKKLSRIIALDPAGPLFNLRVETRRLNRNDAKVVHVIHTDGNKFGFTLACGTIDFFPNGGLAQPGCLNVNFRANLVTTIWDPTFCDHHRSYAYLIESLNSTDSFKSQKCGDHFKFQTNNCDDVVVAMGDLYTEQEGKFYLNTYSVKPYSKPLTRRKIFGF